MSSDAARGRAYAEEFGIPQAVVTLPELFSTGVEAVYIATTNEGHRAETLAAADAGVHVFCANLRHFSSRLSRASAIVMPLYLS